MVPKEKEKQAAIILRKQGLSYKEIAEKIPVSKASLSLWLRNIVLSKKQKERLTQKTLETIKLGSIACKNQRIAKTLSIKKQAREEVGNLSERELWLIGTALYWAEGSKEKETNVSQGVYFSNSDFVMIRLFLKWLSKLEVSEDRIIPEIYIHESHKNRQKNVLKYWMNITNITLDKFRIYFKKNKINTKRKNIGDGYFGLLRVRVNKSSDLNRKISGWIEGISQHCGVV